MNRLRIAAALLAPGLLAGATASPADYWADPASPWVAERLRIERRERQWADLVVLPSRNAWSQGGPRTWNPQEQNPWANTFGTPAEGRARATPLRPRGAPADLRTVGFRSAVVGQHAAMGRRPAHRRRHRQALPGPVLLNRGRG